MGDPTDINGTLDTTGIGGTAIRYDLAHPDLFEKPAEIAEHEEKVAEALADPEPGHEPASDAVETLDTSGTTNLGEYAPDDVTFDHAGVLETSGTVGPDPIAAAVPGDSLLDEKGAEKVEEASDAHVTTEEIEAEKADEGEPVPNYSDPAQVLTPADDVSDAAEVAAGDKEAELTPSFQELVDAQAQDAEASDAAPSDSAPAETPEPEVVDEQPGAVGEVEVVEGSPSDAPASDAPKDEAPADAEVAPESVDASANDEAVASEDQAPADNAEAADNA